MIPAKQFIRECRVAWRRTKTADSAGTELTGGKLLSGSLALHKLLTNGGSLARYLLCSSSASAWVSWNQPLSQSHPTRSHRAHFLRNIVHLSADEL